MRSRFSLHSLFDGLVKISGYWLRLSDLEYIRQTPRVYPLANCLGFFMRKSLVSPQFALLFSEAKRKHKRADLSRNRENTAGGKGRKKGFSVWGRWYWRCPLDTQVETWAW